MSETQKLERGGSRFSFLDFAADKLREHHGECADQGSEVVQDGEEEKRLFSEEESCLDETGVFFVPTTENKQPMLHKCQEQFGVNLSQDATRLLGAPFVEGEMLFPEFEK